MKKQKYLLLASALVLLCSLLSILYAFRKLDLKTVYIASHRLKQRSLISESDLLPTSVPSAYLSEDVILDKEEIIGKVIKLSYSIPSGSFFYKSALNSEINMKDKAIYHLENDEVIYDLYLNELRANINNLRKDLRIDLYVANKELNLESTCFLRGVRILACFNQEGEVLEDSYDEIEILSLAIKEKDLALINKIMMLGEVSIYIGSSAYDENINANLQMNEKLNNLIQG